MVPGRYIGRHIYHPEVHIRNILGIYTTLRYTLWYTRAIHHPEVHPMLHPGYTSAQRASLLPVMSGKPLRRELLLFPVMSGKPLRREPSLLPVNGKTRRREPSLLPVLGEYEAQRALPSSRFRRECSAESPISPKRIREREG